MSLAEGFGALSDTVSDLGKQPGAEDEEVIGLRLGEAVDLGVLELLEGELLGAVAVLGEVSQPIDLLVALGGSGDFAEDPGVILYLEVEILPVLVFPVWAVCGCGVGAVFSAGEGQAISLPVKALKVDGR